MLMAVNGIHSKVLKTKSRYIQRILRDVFLSSSNSSWFLHIFTFVTVISVVFCRKQRREGFKRTLNVQYCSVSIFISSCQAPQSIRFHWCLSSHFKSWQDYLKTHIYLLILIFIFTFFPFPSSAPLLYLGFPVGTFSPLLSDLYSTQLSATLEKDT